MTTTGRCRCPRKKAGGRYTLPAMWLKCDVAAGMSRGASRPWPDGSDVISPGETLRAAASSVDDIAPASG